MYEERYKTIRKLTKPSIAACNLDIYTLFLLAPKYGGCCRLAQILANVSHDSINRFLLRERYDPKDLFEMVKTEIQLVGGILSCDDMVIEKPYSEVTKTDLIGYFWSGVHHRPIKGINLITLFYTDPTGLSVPINYRLYDKREGKTKNQYLREMIAEVESWGLIPKLVTGDSWYSSRENLQFLRNKKLGFLMGVAKNRKVRSQSSQWVKVSKLAIPPDGLVVELKQFGLVKLYKKSFKKTGERYYIIFRPELDELSQLTQQDFKELHSIHWGIETYHRAVKQVCGIGRFMVRTTEAICTHIFCAIRAFTQLELMRAEDLIENWYEIQRNLYLKVARDFIVSHLSEKVNSHTDTSFSVNE